MRSSMIRWLAGRGIRGLYIGIGNRSEGRAPYGKF